MALRRDTSWLSDAELPLRSSARLFLPARIWPARTAEQSAVRAGAGENRRQRWWR